MSNVTAREIMSLTATAFGLLPGSFRGQFFGNVAAKDRPRPLRARQTAVYLIYRHTEATHADIVRLLGLLSPNANLSREQAAIIETELTTDANLKDLVNAIEDQIDALHERRADAALAIVQALPIAKPARPAKVRVRAPTMAEARHG